MKVGYSYWGVCADFDAQASVHVDTADGSRFNRHVLVRKLLSRGHEVIALQQRQEPLFDSVKYDASLPNLDLLFLEWRWPTYKNSGETPKDSDLVRQRQLLAAYHGKVSVVALDNDFQLTSEDEDLWPKLIIAEPALTPRLLTRKRMRLMPWTDWQELLRVREPLPTYGYIGNNYDRPGEFEEYYFKPARTLRRLGVQTAMLGNWLQRSPERGAPEWMIANTEAAFLPRCNFNSAMRTLNALVCTTHISRTEYYASQLIPPRYFEAASVNCPALTPTSGFSLGATTVVTCAEDVRRAVLNIKAMSLDSRHNLCETQRDVLRKTGLFEVTDTVKFLESLCK